MNVLYWVVSFLHLIENLTYRFTTLCGGEMEFHMLRTGSKLTIKSLFVLLLSFKTFPDGRLLKHILMAIVSTPVQLG